MPDNENVLLAVMGGRVRVLARITDPDYPYVATLETGANPRVYEYGVNDGDYTEANTRTVKALMELYGTIGYENNFELGTVVIAGHVVPVSDVSFSSDREFFEKFGYVEGQLQISGYGFECNGYVSNGRFYACISDYDPEINDNRCVAGLYKRGSIPLARLSSLLTAADRKIYFDSFRGSWSQAESALHAALPLEVVGTVVHYGSDGDSGSPLPLLEYTVHL